MRPLDAAQLEKRFKLFERRMTEEELRNEYVFHSARPFAPLEGIAGPVREDERLADAWLGLMPTKTISGIPADGIVASGPDARPIR